MNVKELIEKLSSFDENLNIMKKGNFRYNDISNYDGVKIELEKIKIYNPNSLTPEDVLYINME